jgi:triacylglycerol esterase/lipase EstA (alpha/beta hydrolase family)
MRKSEDVAVAQVDIAGFSTGGIVIRNYVSSPEYKRNNNFNAGDIHKLITLNTPHTGTPWAHLLSGIEPGSLRAKAFAFYACPLIQELR